MDPAARKAPRAIRHLRDNGRPLLLQGNDFEVVAASLDWAKVIDEEQQSSLECGIELLKIDEYILVWE